MARGRAKADAPDAVDFDDLLRSVFEHEELNAEFDDVTAHTFERLGVSDPEMEEDDEFNLALEQFFDVYLTSQ